MTLPTHNHNATDIRIGTTTEPGQIYRQFHLTDRIFRSNRVHIGGTATSRNQFATQIITRWIDLRTCLRSLKYVKLRLLSGEG